MTPRAIVCAGGGGVGKTTTSAALALHLSKSGFRTLIVTVDPARRLAQAMGVDLGPAPQRLEISSDQKGELYALMPEPRESTRTFVEVLFENEPEALERMLGNRVYQTLGDALSGIHELVSLMLIARATEEREYDVVVVDTAPSRYALNFVAYPAKIAALFEGRAVGWFGNLAQKAKEKAGEPPTDEAGLLSWGKKRVESALGRILDARTMRDLASMFSELAVVRGRFAELARASEALLLGPGARFLLVTAPTGSGLADAAFLNRRLKKMKQRTHGVLLNRADENLPEFVGVLKKATGLTLPVEEAVTALEAEWAARVSAADRVAKGLSRDMGRVPVFRWPTIEIREPAKIVEALSEHLGPVQEKLKLK